MCDYDSGESVSYQTEGESSSRYGFTLCDNWRSKVNLKELSQDVKYKNPSVGEKISLDKLRVGNVVRVIFYDKKVDSPYYVSKISEVDYSKNEKYAEIGLKPLDKRASPMCTRVIDRETSNTFNRVLTERNSNFDYGDDFYGHSYFSIEDVIICDDTRLCSSFGILDQIVHLKI